MLAARSIESELVTFRTAGDKHFEDNATAAATRSVFAHEIEAALVRKKVDLAVHALSDMSSERTAGLVVAAIPARDDPRDALVVNDLIEATSIAELPRGTRVGSSSVRVRALLRALFPDVEVVHVRGDLPTRLHKVSDGQVHATIVSAAALQRLEISHGIAAFLEAPDWLPAPGQGATAIQVREDDSSVRDAVAPLDDERTHRDTDAERALLHALEGGLQSPVGGLVIGNASRILHACIADEQGRTLLRAELAIDAAQPELTGVRVANELRAKGASRILDALRAATRTPAPQPDG
jgi:hydroxymethylbilane synthase